MTPAAYLSLWSNVSNVSVRHNHCLLFDYGANWNNLQWAIARAPALAPTQITLCQCGKTEKHCFSDTVALCIRAAQSVVLLLLLCSCTGMFGVLLCRLVGRKRQKKSPLKSIDFSGTTLLRLRNANTRIPPRLPGSRRVHMSFSIILTKSRCLTVMQLAVPGRPRAFWLN